MMTLSPGDSLLHYRVLEKLGQGGMGAVYRAQDLKLSRQVALKLLLTKDTDGEANLRLLREARAVARLSHPNIVAIHAIEDDPSKGLSFLVMELMDGEDLQSKLARGPLSVEDLLGLGGQAADAFFAAHSAGFIHRDIKPANLFLTKRGQLKVLDFGLARSYQSAEIGSMDSTAAALDEYLSVQGKVSGTVSYMSPEQARGEALDPRTDIFSLGIVLYESATGKRPFVGDSILSVLHAVATRTPPPPSSIRPELPLGFDQLIERALAKEREGRYSSAQELAEALQGLVSGSSGSSSSSNQKIKSADRYTVAVLPFANLSGDPQQDYFGDGVVEEIVTALGRVPMLFVIAASSTARYRGKESDIGVIARELNVRYVLTGSVRRAGVRLRISAQLIEARTAAQIWADRFEGSLDELFELQDRISEQVVGAIEPSLLQHEGRLSSHKHPTNLDAHDLYLQAIPLVHLNTAEAAEQALGLLRRSLALDPNYGAAHGYAAWAYEQRFNRGSKDPADIKASVRHAHAALKAVDDPAALSLGGFVMIFFGGDPSSGMAAIERARSLNPSSALACGFDALMKSVGSNQLEEALEGARRTLRLSPFDPMVHYWHDAAGIALFRLGRYNEAQNAFLAAVRANPSFDMLHVLMAMSHEAVGDREAAARSVADALLISPHLSLVVVEQMFASFPFGAQLVTHLRAAGMPPG